MSDEQNKIDLIKKKKNLSFKAIDLIRDHIIKIDPNKIIIDALNYANSKSCDKNIKKNELLEQTKKNAMNSFFSDIKNKENNIELIKNTYEKELKDFTNSTHLLVEKAKKETKEYISKFDILNKKNKMLEQRFLDISNQYKDLCIQQKNSLSQISQMKKRDSLLTVNKPVFNDFLKQFKNQEPKKIIEDIEKQKDGFNTITKEYNNTINKIIFESKLFQIQYKKSNSKVSNTNNQIHNLEEENVLIQKDFENTVNDLQKQIRNLQGLKEDNDKYRKMLYQLYNRLIGAYRLDKNIRKNKKYLQLKREDYKPNLLDDNEICKYIKLMISSMNPSTSDQLLRETIAYSNMITRVYLKNKINLKYDPLSTFKELKDIMEKNEEKMIELTNNAKEYEAKINAMAIENKKLNSMINFFHQEKNKLIENKQNINMTNNVRPSSSGKGLNILEKKYKKVPIRNKKSSVTSSSLISKNKDSDTTSINQKTKTKNRLNSANPSIHSRLTKRRKNISHNFEQIKDKIASFKLVDKKANNKSLSNINPIFNEENKYRYYSIDSKKLKNPLYQSLQSMNTNQLISRHYKVNEGRQSNGLKRKNLKQYDFQSMVTFINEFEKLINHTNRLFLYQAKIAPKFFRDKNLKNAKNNRRIYDVNNLIKTKKKNQSTGNLLQDFVKTKIIGRINGIINNLEYKEKDEGDDGMEIK
jgi:hypothetical protein